jgi:hypothetical protein
MVMVQLTVMSNEIVMPAPCPHQLQYLIRNYDDNNPVMSVPTMSSKRRYPNKNKMLMQQTLHLELVFSSFFRLFLTYKVIMYIDK